MPSLAYLLPLTGSARQAVHGELGFNRWKKIRVYASVPVNSQPWTARCGDRYDPQHVKRSSERVTEVTIVTQGHLRSSTMIPITMQLYIDPDVNHVLSCSVYSEIQFFTPHPLFHLELRNDRLDHIGTSLPTGSKDTRLVFM